MNDGGFARRCVTDAVPDIAVGICGFVRCYRFMWFGLPSLVNDAMAGYS